MATPPTFSSGSVLTAAQMNSVGLWLVKTQTIGTAVSSVTVTGDFSADYDNYLITVSGGAHATGGIQLSLKMGATVTGYYYSFAYSPYSSAVAAVSGSNAGNWDYVGASQTGGLSAYIELNSPFLSKNTTMRASVSNQSNYAGTSNGWLNNTTSYTSFILLPASGTLTGGTIAVYGYKGTV